MRPMAEFGESVFYLPAKGSVLKHKADAKPLDGVLLGVDPKTDEAIGLWQERD